jgi:protein SCO1
MRSALLGIGMLAVLAGSGACTRVEADPECFSRTSEKVGGPFSLTAHDGTPMTEDNFKGRKTLVFFGFTYCPDVCPVTLYSVGQAMKLLPKNVKPPRTVLISVDPARDTPEALSTYIRSNGFPDDITGLTGTIDELEAVAKGFGSSFSRIEDSDSATGYQVNHGTILYLMDENWKLETFFREGVRPETIAKCIAALS